MQAVPFLTSLFLLEPRSLLNTVGSLRDASLEVSDDCCEYSTEEGDGAWIREYLTWLKNMWYGLTQEDVNWRYYSRFDDDAFRETLTTAYHRNLVVEFTNRYYVEWRENQIHIPSMDDVNTNVQDHLCSECDNDDAWEQEYDMSLAPIDPTLWLGWEQDRAVAR